MIAARCATCKKNPMITRDHQKNDTRSSATYSSCERYRYALTRCWEPSGRRALFIMLNPSKATEQHNDPTVERCERRARALGFGAFRVANIFAWRETDPKMLRAADSPIGHETDRLLQADCNWADQIICGWGAHGAHLGRGGAVELLLRATGRPLYHLGLTKDGHPRHPLYIAYSVKPIHWSAAALDD